MFTGKDRKMKTKKTVRLSIFVFLLILPVWGCGYLQKQPLAYSDTSSDRYVEDVSMANRFSENSYEKTTPVDSAIELSGKYAALSNEAAELKQNNRSLAEQNSLLKQKADELNKQLLQTQKELTEANDLLINMRVELNNWKTNVIGFRDEIRQVDSEQLKALIKILELLGGEVKTRPTDNAQAKPDSRQTNTQLASVNRQPS